MNIIDRQSGKFQLTDDFSVSASSSELEVCKHFRLESIKHPKTNFSYLIAKDVVIDNFHFKLNFSFKNAALECILFKVHDGPFPENYKAPESDWGYSEEEMALFEYQYSWLVEQVGEQTKFPWGEIKAMWQPLAGGAIIYLQYN